jgi:hypothetical protein
MSFNTSDSRSFTTKDADSSPEVFKKGNTKTATLLVRNTGEKTATYKVEGSIDGEHFVDLVEAADLAKEKSKVHSITDYWPILRITGKSKEAGKPTTVAIAIASIEA